MLEIILAFAVGLVAGFVVSKFLNKNSEGDLTKDLQELKKTIDDLKSEQSEDRGTLKEKLKNLDDQRSDFITLTNQLKTSLTGGGNQIQGNWGQRVLEYILVDKLGMTEGLDFDSQESYREEDGLKIPDVVIHLPKERDIVVDSKVSLTAWDEYLNADDEVIKREAKKRHITELSKKNYQSIYNIKSLDAVIMFVPNEQAFSSLGDDTRDIIKYALSKKITIVGPSMIFYILKTVEQIWKTEKQSKNIETVISLATNAYDKAYGVYQAADAAAKSFKQVDEKIHDVMNKIKDGKGSLMGTLDKIKNTGGLSPKKEIPSKEFEDK